MADSLVSRFGCYTIIWDTTKARGWRARLSIASLISEPENFHTCFDTLSH